MDRFTAYCDLAFLDAFARLLPEGEAGSSEDVDRWGAINGFLLRAANVVVRARVEDLEALVTRHPMLLKLLDRPAGTTLELDERPFVSMEERGHHERAGLPWRVYFVEETQERTGQLTDQTGVLFADATGALDAWRRLGSAAFVGIGTSDPDQLRSWAGLDGRWSPSHDLILADRYLFSNAVEAEQNLIPLLLSLLPDRGSAEPSVLLVARGRDAEAFDDDARKAWDFVRTAIHRVRPDLQVKLTVALLDRGGDVETGLHDRRLFLRYGFVESGASINNCFWRGAPNCTTRLTFTPLVDPAALSRVVAELQSLSWHVQEAWSRGEHVVAGKPSHPLLPRPYRVGDGGSQALHDAA